MSVLAPNSQVLCREIYHQIQIQRDQTQQSWFGGNCSVLLKSYGLGFDRKGGERKKMAQRRDLKASAFWQDSSRPTTIEMEPILDSDQLDQILLKSKDLSQPIIIDWMASWCRKCIYLKPKLEKLAAEFDTKMKFYCVDVNKVPQALVKRGNISKMPTIQLWKDGEMKAEVIGGHKAWLVLDEVREMIHKFV